MTSFPPVCQSLGHVSRLNELALQVCVLEADEDWLLSAAIVKAVGWIALLIGIKGIFAILVTRADAKRKPVRPPKVSSPEPDLSPKN